MTENEIRRGQRLEGRDRARIGVVDAVFADYLLVRTASIIPVDLYVPRSALGVDGNERLVVDASPREAYDLWHRPLKRVEHD